MLLYMKIDLNPGDFVHSIILHLFSKKFMRYSARFRIYPTPTQMRDLGIAMEAQRCIYNAKVEYSRLQEWFRNRETLEPSLNTIDSDLDLNIKEDKTYAQYKLNNDIPCVPSQILKSGVDKYIQAVRNHHQNPRKWRKPRPHRLGRSVTLIRELFEIRENGLWVGRPKWPVGLIPMKAHRPHGTPATVVISETSAGRWFASFSWEDGQPEPMTDRAMKKQIKANGEAALKGKVLGMDRGVRPLVALSTSEDLGLDAVLHGPKVQRLHTRKRRLKRKLARQQGRDSRRRQNTLRELGRVYERLQDIRRDAFRKAVHHLVQGPNEVFVLEDLKLQTLQKSLRAKAPGGRLKHQSCKVRRKVAGAMTRSSLSEFARTLQIAANRAGKLLLKVPAQNTSTTCHACGHRSPENRPVRDRFQCVVCHQVTDPDVNAARNLVQLGLRSLFPKSPDGQPGAKARGGAGSTARKTAPKSGPRTRRSEKPSLPTHHGWSKACHVDASRSYSGPPSPDEPHHPTGDPPGTTHEEAQGGSP